MPAALALPRIIARPAPIVPLVVAVRAFARPVTTVRQADRRLRVVLILAPANALIVRLVPLMLVLLPHLNVLLPVVRRVIIFTIKLAMLAVTTITIVLAAFNIRFLPVIIRLAEPRRLETANPNAHPELTVLLASHIHVLAAATARLTV